ncbi:MAG: hypothetical protein ACE5NG_06285 [bacterium]
MIRQKELKLQKFVLAKTAQNTLHGQEQLKYKRNFEKALIISILAAIFGIHLAANFDIDKYIIQQESVRFETIDIPLIEPIIEQPPVLKMEQVVEVNEENNEENVNLKEIEELLGENEEEAELALNSDDLGASLLSSSPLGSILGPDIKFRKRFSNEDGKISLKTGKFHESLIAENELDIGKVQRNERGTLSDDVNIDLAHQADKKPDQAVNEKFNANDISLGIAGVPAKILSFSSSTIGTEDYKLWNKLNAELDRLNKGRYGSIPKEIKRHKRGFILSLSYSDGVTHEIHWRQDGNVWIKVFGQSHKTTLQELRRALNGLITLSLSN